MFGFPGDQQTGGVPSAGDAQTAARLVEVAVDRVLGDPQPPGDFLGMQMVGDQPEAFPLARGQPADRQWILYVPHNWGGKSQLGVSSIPHLPIMTIPLAAGKPAWARSNQGADPNRGVRGAFWTRGR